MKRVRLDDELISQGICADRADALRTLMAGLVSSGGERLTSPGLKVTPGLPLHVKGRMPYVGRGGLKLEGALDAFGINPTGLACLDVGRKILPSVSTEHCPTTQWGVMRSMECVRCPEWFGLSFV